MRSTRPNQAMQRTATRCATTFSNDQNASTSIGARSRQPSLILFSLGGSTHPHDSIVPGLIV